MWSKSIDVWYTGLQGSDGLYIWRQSGEDCICGLRALMCGILGVRAVMGCIFGVRAVRIVYVV